MAGTMRLGGRMVALLALIQLLLTGCQQLLFRQDGRITILTPAIYSTVREPVTISWTARAFATPADGRFAIFIDRDPMPPGETLGYFKPRDRTGIFVEARTSLRIDVFDHKVGVDPAERYHHDVTVVLLDRNGRRIGEEAGFTEFTVRA